MPSEAYTGLGMRLRKNDPTGAYWYLADGVSPASPLLTDGHTSFTPGISEYSTALGSRFYVADAQGNSRGLLDGTQAATDGYNWDAFGISMSRFGSNPTALAWGEESGYQTDNDSGLKLLGHRYYDSRTGRFISQDPIGDGDNWYEYADNSPTNETDPTGLFECQGWSFDQIYNEAAAEGGPGSSWETTQTDAQGNKTVIGQFMISDFNLGTATPGAGMGGMGGGGMGGGMLAGRQGPEREPIDPDRGHGPQGTGNHNDKHTRTRSGDKGNQNLGQRGYPSKPEGQRARERRLEQEAKKEAERQQRDAQFEVIRQGLAADAAVASEDLAFAEFLFAADEAAIAVGVIVK